MRQHTLKASLARSSAAVLTAAVVASASTTALAKVTGATGMDWMYDAESNKIDVISVQGDAGDLVYLDVYNNDRQIATHLESLLEGSDDHVLSLSFDNGFDQTNGYSLVAYTDRDDADGSKVFEGMAQMVYGDFGGTVAPIAVHTVASGSSRDFSPSKTYVRAGQTFELASADPVADPAGAGRLVYSYQLPADAPQTVTGHVNIVDGATGEVIQTQDVELDKDEGIQHVAIPRTVRVSNRSYRPMLLQESVGLGYAGPTEVTITAREIGTLDTDVSYTAYINYVDEDGLSLGRRGQTVDGDEVGFEHRLPIFRPTSYTPPKAIYLNVDGEVASYVLSEDNPVLDANGQIFMEPTDAGDLDSLVYEVRYRRMTDQDESTWTITLKNGLDGLEEVEQRLATLTCTWKKSQGYVWTMEGVEIDPTDDAFPFTLVEGEDGRTITLTPKASISVSGEAYDIADLMNHEFSHTFSAAEMDVNQDIYYRPSDANTPDAPYTVQVNYVNIATGETISSTTQTSSPESREDLAIELPQTFVDNGVTWVLLNGQATTLYHNYYSRTKSYAVYYRDENDLANANTTVTVVETTTDPAATVATTDEGTAAPATGTETDTPAAASDETETDRATLESGNGLRIVEGDNGSDLVTPDGTDLETERIEDEANPLAAAPAEEAAKRSGVSSATTTVVMLIAAIATALIAFVMHKMRGDEAYDIDSDE